MMKINSCAAALLVGMLTFPASAANLAGNPGFEIAGGGGATDSDLWTEFSGGPAGTLSERDGSMPFAGSFAHHLVAAGDPTAGASAGINQNSIADVGLPSLKPGSTLSASFEWKSSYGPGGVGNAFLRILNGVGAIVADTGAVPLPDTGGVYAGQSTPALNVPAFGPAPNDTYAAFLEITTAAGAFTGSTAAGFVDDVVIDGTAIPEPASVVLMGVGLICLVGVAKRRRRA